MEIPILRNHDTEDVIGKIYDKDDGLYFRFNGDVVITRDQLFSIFNCGCSMLEFEVEYPGTNENDMKVTDGRIFEFSLPG